MPSREELTSVLGPTWQWQASTSARKVACRNCGAKTGTRCSPLETVNGRASCDARVDDAAAYLYQRRVSRRDRHAPAHVEPLAAVSTESEAERSRLFLKSMRLTDDERAYLLGEVWSSADQPAFMPGDDLFLSTAAAMLLAHRGEARVVVYDREGRERGVLWAPVDTRTHEPDISPAVDPRSAEEIRAAYIAFAVDGADKP